MFEIKIKLLALDHLQEGKTIVEVSNLVRYTQRSSFKK